MAERKENSVLFSLNELRSIEEERQQEAVDSKRRAEEERIRAKQEAERAAREAAESRQRAIEEAERAARDASERASREERIRIEETERRARIDAQSQIEQQRLAQEMQIRAIEAQKKRPTGLIAMAVVLVLAVAGLAIFLVKRSNEAEKREQEMALYRAEVDSKTQELQRLVDDQNTIITQLREAKTVEERQRAEEALAAKQADIEAKKKALDALKQSGKASSGGGSSGGGSAAPKRDDQVKVICNPNDPLCGM
jgi:colicin import membrane protein